MNPHAETFVQEVNAFLAAQIPILKRSESADKHSVVGSESYNLEVNKKPAAIRVLLYIYIESDLAEVLKNYDMVFMHANKQPIPAALDIDPGSHTWMCYASDPSQIVSIQLVEKNVSAPNWRARIEILEDKL